MDGKGVHLFAGSMNLEKGLRDIALELLRFGMWSWCVWKCGISVINKQGTKAEKRQTLFGDDRVLIAEQQENWKMPFVEFGMPSGKWYSLRRRGQIEN